MASEWQETALSEVIGFILILAIITAAASLYVVYVVPAQGREAEIRHMEYISGEFTGYKIGLDSLWINNREDVTISRTISLGTLGATTQGSFLNLPLFQPYGSSGTMVVNGRGDTIGYEVVGVIIEDYPGNYTPGFNPIEAPPRHLYLEFKSTDTSSGDGIRLTPDNSDNADWVVWLNVTHIVTSAQTGPVGTFPTFTGTGLSQVIAYLQSDALETWANSVGSSVSTEPALTITVIKNGNETLSNWVIKRNIQDNVYYLVDLLDPAYGLGNDVDYSFTLLRDGNDVTGELTTGTIITNYPVSVGYSSIPGFVIPDHPMGTLEYLSNNYYWIQQNYYYQNGAVFLEQPDDGSVVKVLPAITLTSDQPGKVKVHITDIQILSSMQSLGGTGSAEVTSFISGITMDETESGIQYARGIPNAQTVIITVNTDSEQSALAWDGAFRRVKSLGLLNGVPDGWSSVDPHSSGSTTSTFRITGASPTGYDILLDYTRVNMSASLQSVAA
jgi:hypothetical protein